MADSLLRFVHAGDFHLEQPVVGLPSAPDHLRDLLIDAPYLAARRVFETAVVEEADFVALCGDILDVDRAGPRGISFLLEQFELLHEHGIAVYWAGGKSDHPELWPAAAKLPASVHVFSTGQVEELSHFRHDRPLATILGRSSTGLGRNNSAKRRIRPADFRVDSEEAFTVAIAHGDADAESMTKLGIGYWALGGRHGSQTLCTTPGTIRYCGSPQGRTPLETGPHGCTLATVDFDRQANIKPVATDAARWERKSLALSDDDTRDVLEAVLIEQTNQWAAESGGRAVLAQWTIEAPGALGEKLRRGLAAELVSFLQAEFGKQPTQVWTSAIEVAPSPLPAKLYDEDTILGDFLRSVRDHLADDDLPLDAEVLLGDGRAADIVSAVLDVSRPAIRQAVLREAATLGFDLLRGGATRQLTIAAEEASP